MSVQTTKDKVNQYVKAWFESSKSSVQEKDHEFLDNLFANYPDWDDAGVAPLETYVIMHAVFLMIIDPSDRREYYNESVTNADGHKTCLKGTEILFDTVKINSVDLNDIDSIIECLNLYSQKYYAIMGV